MPDENTQNPATEIGNQTIYQQEQDKNEERNVDEKVRTGILSMADLTALQYN